LDFGYIPFGIILKNSGASNTYSAFEIQKCPETEEYAYGLPWFNYMAQREKYKPMELGFGI
jgi:hypothetical protein